MTSRAVTFQKSAQGRLWLIDGGAAPQNLPEYMGYAKAGGISRSLGDLTPVRIPSATAYEAFDTVDTIRGQEGLPTLSMDIMKQRVLSRIYRMADRKCILDAQIHIGACKNPADFDQGYDIVAILEGAGITNYSTNDLIAMDADQNAVILETIDAMGARYYEVKPLAPATLGAVAVTDQLVKVMICDSVTCASCGVSSDGCQIIFAITTDTSGSPGLNARILYSSNGGSSWSTAVINSMGAAEIPTGAFCMGPYVVVFSGGSNDRMHYALARDILAGTASWSVVTAGFVGAGSPAGGFAYNSNLAFIVGDAGYIYRVTDPTGTVTAVTTGDITAQNLISIHAYDDQNIVAVGASNVVLRSTNGGINWSLLTGPVGAASLNAVWMYGQAAWYIGTGGGTLWYTNNNGQSYTQIGIPDSGSGSITDIRFATNSVGYLGRTMTSAPRAQILRTINGGASWRRAEGTNSMPTGQTIASIAACSEDPNVVFGAGLATDLGDGFLVKLS